MSQTIRDLHTQSQSKETWNTYLATRKQKPAASPVANPRPFAAPATSLRSWRTRGPSPHPLPRFAQWGMGKRSVIINVVIKKENHNETQHPEHSQTLGQGT